MNIINIGILAHVDAGKTTLTERLLYASGTISEPGSVEKGTTRTDTMFLERQRGITIQTAVTSFQWHSCKVNIVDTPGHMDFLAEVYRSLAVLDGAILVLSAKDGVQAQTRVLFHALRKLNIPTIIFINKIDQVGIDLESVYQSVRDKLSADIIIKQTVSLSPEIVLEENTDIEAWDAVIEITEQNGARCIPIQDFYIQAGKVDLRPGELQTAILIPKAAYEGYQGHYIKYAMRNAMDIATTGCSVNVKLSADKKTIEDMRIAYGVAGPVPMRASFAEQTAKGRPVTIETIKEAAKAVLDDIHPRDSWRASKAFREHIAVVLAKRALETSIRLSGGEWNE